MSSRIFESLARINRGGSAGFDFTKSAESNSFPYKHKGILDSTIEELPILPKETTWEAIEDNLGQSLRKKYKFMDKKHMLYFLEESINRSERIDHHPVMTIKGNTIDVTLRTDVIQDISELDKDFSKFLDEIYEDIHFIGDNF
jgi:pterin-4a-carbinolamine dehydratase